MTQCPHCGGTTLQKNGTRPGRDNTRVRMYLCSSCKRSSSNSADTVISTSSTQPNQNQVRMPSQRPSQSITNSSHSETITAIPSLSNQTGFVPTSYPQLAQSAQRVQPIQQRLEINMPLDWSANGLLEFARHAQHDLAIATSHFEHPSVPELEWQALSPRLRTFLQAKQKFDLAVTLQLSSLFTTSPVPLEQNLNQPAPPTRTFVPVPAEFLTSRVPATFVAKKRLIIPKIGLELAQKIMREAADQFTDQSNPNQQAETTQTSDEETDSDGHQTALARAGPDQILKLEEDLQDLQNEKKEWFLERIQLKQVNMELEMMRRMFRRHLENVQKRFERLKAEVRQAQKPINETTPARVKKDTQTRATQREINESIVSKITESFTASSSNRIAVPALSAGQQANIERLASTLMANLVRLEHHRVKPREIAHVTGEQSSWRAVIDHLMIQGKLERDGEYVTISLVERLRRGLTMRSSVVKK